MFSCRWMCCFRIICL
ncbi:UNVERIFIED_CONTAM: hypothetical protein NCL1_45388 [Trichonephila clavipes]